MVRKQFSRLLILGLILGAGLWWGVAASVPDTKLHWVACDVGQGDAILLTFRSTQVLIDGGPDSQVIDCLSRHLPFWDRELEVVVLTHPQADHMHGLIEVLRRYQVSEVVLSGAVSQTDGFLEFRSAVVDEGATIDIVKEGDAVRLEPLRIEILWPKQPLATANVWKGEESDPAVLGVTTTQSDVNETSVVLLAEYGDFRALMAGDIGMTTEQALMSDGLLESMDVLKVAHHGSKYSTSSVFLGVVRPQFAVVSVGDKNRYGHPAGETLMRLDRVGARIFRTDELGDVEIVSDGKDFWVVE